jgi:hypothetical protein
MWVHKFYAYGEEQQTIPGCIICMIKKPNWQCKKVKTDERWFWLMCAEWTQNE